MEVVPTSDGDDDDSVAWYRCPQCQGFLPKLKSQVDDEESDTTSGSTTGTPDGATDVAADRPAAAEPASPGSEVDIADLAASDTLPWDSPADMVAAQKRAAAASAAAGDGESELETPDAGTPEDAASFEAADLELDDADVDDDVDDDDEPPAGKATKADVSDTEPVHEYAALLAEKDPLTAAPYRPWESYEVEQCIHHLAWDDCGVVVAKEKLPGGRKVIKVYFAETGVVRLIEQDES